MDDPLPFVDPVMFQNITESTIMKSALRTRGSSGPSGLDADGWRRILVSKNFGNVGKDLRWVSFVLIGEYIQYSPLINFRLIIPSNIHLQSIIPSNNHLQCLCSTKNEKKQHNEGNIWH
jgi:hypothetical protein